MPTAPIAAEVKLPDGDVWKNLVTEEKSKPAETLAEFRGNYKYNLLDQNLRAFNAEVPMFAQWDDHEVTNNWWPGEHADRRRASALTIPRRTCSLLAARASRAFHEYMPMRPTPAEPGRVYRKIAYGPLLDVFMLDMRSYRGPNGERREESYGPAAYFLGPDADRLAQARADAFTRDLEGDRRRHADRPDRLRGLRAQWGVEAVAQGDGPPLGRELEIADLLAFIKHAGVRNTVWLTADVHYTAAHYYDPNKAAFQDFEPFWEFVSGPIHAGTFGRATLDNTFGPQLDVRQGACSKEQGDEPRRPASACSSSAMWRSTARPR